ncbi:MAG: ArsA family ATPase [Acidimicrobiales bacterium]
MSSSASNVVSSKEVLVVVGPGGVGKTTVSAALGLGAVSALSGRVLVLTVDPAKRLATALGLASLGNDERRVADSDLNQLGLNPRGELWVAQLDMKQSWDDLVIRHAPDTETRDAILANSLYENVTAKFVASHDYIAMERLHELHQSGRFDLIVVDTPPSRHAVDFLDSPERMADFFGSWLLRWLTIPYRSRFLTAASRPFYSVADRVLGQEFLREVADFFMLFQTMYEGFVERAEEVSRTLRDRRTGFLAVTTLESAAVVDTTELVDALEQRELGLAGVVLNRVLPAGFSSESAAESAVKLAAAAPELAHELAGAGTAAVMERVLVEASETYLDYAGVANHQQQLQVEMAAKAPLLASLPFLPGDIGDLAGLAAVSSSLFE